MEIKTTLRGLDDVDRLLSQIAPREAKNILRATVHGAAGEIRNEARKRAPSDGPVVHLKPAIKTKRERGTPTRIESTVRVQKSAFYWRFHEYGTVKMAARPFFGPAVLWYDTQRNAVLLRQFVKKFEAAIKRAKKRQAR